MIILIIYIIGVLIFQVVGLWNAESYEIDEMRLLIFLSGAWPFVVSVSVLAIIVEFIKKSVRL